MFCYELAPVFTRTRGENAIQLNVIAKLDRRKVRAGQMRSSICRTNTVESVSSAPMPSLQDSRTCVWRMRFKANSVGLGGLGIDTIQCDHKSKLIAGLASVDPRSFPAILLTSGK